MLRLSLIAAAILSATAAMAQDNKESPPLQKVEIKGAAEAYNPRRDDTANKIIVSSEELKRYGDTSIGDALKRVPGVTVGAGGRDIRMRGLGSGYTQILLNGERVPPGFNIETLSPDSIERIEVIRSASAEFSTQSIAGTINIVLKRAVKSAQREFKFGVGRSSEFTNPNGNLILSDKDGKFSYSVNLGGGRFEFDRRNWTDDEQRDLAGRPTMRRRLDVHDVGHARGIELSPRLNWNLENGDTLTSQSFINRNVFNSAIERDIGMAPVDEKMFDAARIQNLNKSLFARTDLNWVHKMGEGAKLDAKLGGSRQRSDGRWYETDIRKTVPDLQHDVFSGQREWSVTTTGKYSTPLFTDHALAMGWDVGYTSRYDWRNQRDLFLDGERDDKDEGYDASLRRAAFYAQDEWNLTPRWSVYAGLRWEGMHTRSSGPGFDPVDNRSSVWSPLAQTLYKMENGKDQLRAALTRTYKAPQARNLSGRRFTSTNNSQTDPDWIGNPDLKPELATGIDASYEHYWAEGALFSASVALRRIGNYTRRDLLQDAAGRYYFTMLNKGNATVRSLDLETKFPLKAVMADAPAVDLRANISRNWSKVDSVPGPDNRLDQQVPLSANLGVDYKTPDGVWSAGASFTFRAGGAVRLDTDRSSHSTHARELDFYLAWKLDKQSQLRLSGWNLLAKESVTASYFDTDAGRLSSVSTTPGARGARLQFETRF